MEFCTATTSSSLFWVGDNPAFYYEYWKLCNAILTVSSIYKWVSALPVNLEIKI